MVMQGYHQRVTVVLLCLILVAQLLSFGRNNVQGISAEAGRKAEHSMSSNLRTPQKNEERPRRVHGFLHNLGVSEPYAILSGQLPQLVVDVGGHSGTVTEIMLAHGHRVKAYEPWPGNVAAFKTRMAGRTGWELIEAAVSDTPGNLRMYAKTEDLMSTDATVTTMKTPGASPIDLPVVTLDDTIDEHIFLLKIDVQKHEIHVLNGVERVWREHGIDIIVTEYMGQKDVLEWFYTHGYECFDMYWLQITTGDSLDTYRGVPIVVEQEGTLTTGSKMRHIFVKNAPRDFKSFSEIFRPETDNLIRDRFASQTDLMCVTTAIFESMIL